MSKIIYTPAYNAENTRRVDSILNQTHKILFTFLDNASTDGTYEIIKNMPK